MTYSPVSMPPRAGFGLDVVYHNDKTNQDGVANVGIGPYCDDVCGMQTMLLLLDQSPGPIDCDPGPQTRAALTSYGLSRGVPYNPQTTPQGPICAALIADYSAKFPGGSAGGGGQCPPGQWGVPPLCFGEKTIENPPPNLCPEGSYGQPPYCVSIPGTTGATPPTGSTQCPTGTVGLPPNCYGLPTGIPGLPTTTTPTTTVPPYTTPPVVVEPPPKPGVPAPPKPGLASWWAARSTAERAVVIGGGAAVGLLLVVLLMPKGRKTAVATPNRRRTRRRAKANLRAGRKVKRRGALRPTGKIITLKSGARFGHLTPPKKYRRRGAVRKSQYAWPDGYQYPVHDAQHCRVASSRFGKHKRRYPQSVRRTIAKNINRCKAKFGIGGPPVKP